jgi:hypothetical protein
MIVRWPVVIHELDFDEEQNNYNNERHCPRYRRHDHFVFGRKKARVWIGDSRTVAGLESKRGMEDLTIRNFLGD